MTASKDLGKRSTMLLPSNLSNGNEKKIVEFLKMEQEEEQCFRNFCKSANIL